MKSNHDPQLEHAISRELKTLPELTAPASASKRVLAIIAKRENVPWYRRPWVAWPVSVQTVSFLLMLAMFVGLAFAGWELSKTQTMAHSAREASQWISIFDSIRNVSDIVVGAAVLVVKKLGAVFIVISLVSMGLAYAFFLWLGTICFRLAFVKPSPSRL